MRLARSETCLSPQVRFLLTVSRRYFFCGSFVLFMFCVCVLIHIWTNGEVGVLWNQLKPSSKIFLLTVPMRCFFCGSFMLFLSSFCYAFVHVGLLMPCSRGLTSSGVWFLSCHFPIGILGQVWCLIVSLPDHCSLSYFCWYIIIKKNDMHTSIRFRQQLSCLYCSCNQIKISKDLLSWGI